MPGTQSIFVYSVFSSPPEITTQMRTCFTLQIRLPIFSTGTAKDNTMTSTQCDDTCMLLGSTYATIGTTVKLVLKSLLNPSWIIWLDSGQSLTTPKMKDSNVSSSMRPHSAWFTSKDGQEIRPNILVLAIGTNHIPSQFPADRWLRSCAPTLDGDGKQLTVPLVVQRATSLGHLVILLIQPTFSGIPKAIVPTQVVSAWNGSAKLT